MSQPQPEQENVVVPNLGSAWNADLCVKVTVQHAGSSPQEFVGCYYKDQTPSAGKSVGVGTAAVLRVTATNSSPTPLPGKVTVGDYVNTMTHDSLSVTLEILDEGGTIEGSFPLIEYGMTQSPAAGTQVDLNSVVSLTLSAIIKR